VRDYASAALRAADARHRVPTPIEDVQVAAHLTAAAIDQYIEAPPPSLARKFKRLTAKIRGFLSSPDRVLWVDPDLRHTQRRFVLAHEIGHHVLPWQREAYAVDGQPQLTPDTKELFEREANQFASHLLFNIDDFTDRAAAGSLSLTTPIALSSDFDASLIASCRRFVEEHPASCALLVLGQFPTRSLGKPAAKLLYGVQSASFERQFGAVMRGLRLPQAWPSDFHDLASDCYLAVTRQGFPLSTGIFHALNGVSFLYEVLASRPHPIVLISPRKKFQFPSRVPEVRFNSAAAESAGSGEQVGVTSG